MSNTAPRKTNTGVYLLRNKVTGDTYIGATTDLDATLRRHWNRIAKGTHKTPRVNASFAGHGVDALEVSILEHTPEVWRRINFDRRTASTPELQRLWDRCRFWVAKLQPSLIDPRLREPAPNREEQEAAHQAYVTRRREVTEEREAARLRALAEHARRIRARLDRETRPQARRYGKRTVIAPAPATLPAKWEPWPPE